MIKQFICWLKTGHKNRHEIGNCKVKKGRKIKFSYVWLCNDCEYFGMDNAKL